MSFIIQKMLVCGLCRKKASIDEENFPEDLHYLLSKYCIPQIYWICKTCEKSSGLECSFGKILNLEDDVQLLKSSIQRLETEMITVKKFIGMGSGDQPCVSEFSFFESLPTNGSRGDSQVPVVNEKVDLSKPICSQKSRSSSADSSSSSLVYNSDDCSPKRNKEAHAIIHNIVNTKIKIDDGESTRSSFIVSNFMTCITQSLKKIDPVFNCLYSRDYKTGSSYNDLRISAASEYDIDIVFKMPSQIVLEVEFFKQTMAFAKIKWREEGCLPESKSFVMKFLNKNSDKGYLQPLKITSWFQGLIDQFQSQGHKISGVKNIRSIQSGPARTIRIETDENYVLDIDLVPVFMFSYDILAGTQLDEMLQKYPVDETKKFWFLVPKQCRGEEQLLASECLLSWRLDFPEVEKKVLYNKQCAKSVIKLLKLLRDINDWKSLASYYLKTLVLWEVDRKPENENWKGSLLFYTFLETMKRLQQYLKDQHLPFFFYPSYNLIHGMNKDHCENMRSRLQKLISQIEADPANLRKIFLDS